jgi:dipeptidyl aminopeptidase/acylaminoacyl peptidase
MKSRAAVLLSVFPVLAVACGGGAGASSPTPGPLPAVFQSGDVRLAFTLDLPQGRGPFPAVVMGHGSGRITRHDLTWASQRWTAMGFAVLRFDKRGVGESTGQYSAVGVPNGDRMFGLLASDIAAGVRFLRSRPEVDGRRIGLTGNSQAGWILPLAARELGDVSFMVILAGPVCSVGMENYYSDLAEWSERPLEEVYARLPEFKGPHGFDPVPVLTSVHTPSLWLLGEDDRSIPVRDTVANLKALAAEGHPFEWRTYPGVGHSLSPRIWDDIAPWVARHR